MSLGVTSASLHMLYLISIVWAQMTICTYILIDFLTNQLFSPNMVNVHTFFYDMESLTINVKIFKLFQLVLLGSNNIISHMISKKM